jgi:ABC-type Na+ transport system ATPase subunit NatA
MIKINDLYLKKKIPEISHLNLRVDDGESYTLLSSGDNSVNRLIDIFSGLERDFKGTVEIDDVDILSGPGSCRDRLSFLSGGTKWPPDMKTSNLVSFFHKYKWAEPTADEFEELYIKLNLEHIGKKRIGELEEVEWRKILFSLTQLKKNKNYIFRDFAKGMPLDFNLEFKKNLIRLKKNGCSILYFSDDVFFAPEIGDRIGFMKKGKLLLELKANKMKNMSLKELYFQFLAEQ